MVWSELSYNYLYATSTAIFFQNCFALTKKFDLYNFVLVQGVLSGDPMQLGPILQSNVAISYGLGVSLLERMMNRDSYQRDVTKFADHGNYDPLLVRCWTTF